MRALIAVCAWVLAVPVPAAAADAPVHAAGVQANPYWSLKEARIRAYRERDRRFFEQLLADHFVSLAPDGRHLDRAQYLDAEFSAASRDAPPVETEVADFHATRTGDTLVLAYRETERAQVGDNAFAVPLARLDVYVRKGAQWRLQAMTAVRIPQAPAVVAKTTAELQAYEGVYEFAPDIQSTVRLVDGRLMEQTTGNPEGLLLPVGDDEFYAPPDLEARVEFKRDASGKVVAQVYRSGTQVLRAPRRDVAKP